ncbi:MAG: hypothetical protein LCH91_05295 [Bacteroidetes bacterium]|nr:hypothetical protein [Bacteroidota bacterium]
MLRLTIITENHVETLTVAAALYFREVFEVTTPEELNKVFKIDEVFLYNFSRMKPCLGFSESKRAIALSNFTLQHGKNAIITNRWLSTTNTANRDYLRKIVAHLNTNQPLTISQSKLLKSYGIATC